jgi:3,4-dihydroxy 2-butanone 4-phosphate synthase/GTP cyclohydrolase II
MSFASVPELIEDIRAGKMVVIVDDEDRENEGDLIMAASKVRPEDINFMVTHARGLVCLSLTRERCAQLRLPQMVVDNNAPHRTAFTAVRMVWARS